MTFPVQVTLANCDHEGDTCGEIAYTDPDHPPFLLCAPQLTYLRPEGERFVFEEGPGYRSDQCFPTVLKIAFLDERTADVEQYGDGPEPVGTGSLIQVSSGPEPTPLPEFAAIDGLDGPVVSVDLGGPSTQYTAGVGTSAYFPVDGAVVSVDSASGEPNEAATFDDEVEGEGEDPHSVIALGEAVWAARAGTRSLVRVDDAATTNDEIELEYRPYAMAADSDGVVWVTSFEDSQLLRVDTVTGSTEAAIAVDNPTGVAVGDGRVWVVEHRTNRIAVVDPTTNEVTDRISLGEGGENDVCGMCVENIVFAEGAAWTANNHDRSVSRIDAETLEVTRIPTDHRPWAVAFGDGRIWASQMENAGSSPFIDPSVGGLAAIDLTDLTVEQFDAPGVLSVSWLAEQLWLLVPGPRSDLVYSYTPAD